VRNKARPAFGAGRGWATRPSGLRWVFPTGARQPILIIVFLISRWHWVSVGSSACDPGVARKGGYRATTHETCRGPLGWWPSMGVKTKDESVGLLRSPTQAPLVGVGADFKTTASWGGRSSPLGPNVFNASMGEPP
jgi:hypothetical protein